MQILFQQINSLYLFDDFSTFLGYLKPKAIFIEKTVLVLFNQCYILT